MLHQRASRRRELENRGACIATLWIRETATTSYAGVLNAKNTSSDPGKRGERRRLGVFCTSEHTVCAACCILCYAFRPCAAYVNNRSRNKGAAVCETFEYYQNPRRKIYAHYAGVLQRRRDFSDICKPLRGRSTSVWQTTLSVSPTLLQPF